MRRTLPTPSAVTALQSPIRIAITITGEDAQLLDELAEHNNIYPTAVIRELIRAAHAHLTQQRERAAAEAKAQADKVEAERLRDLRRKLAAATLERKTAALQATKTYKGVEIAGSRFRAFVENGDGTREPLGTFSTAEEAAQAHDGELWERIAAGTVQGLAWAKFPKSSEFNWPQRDGYMTVGDFDVETTRRAYFHACVKEGVEPDRGFLRPEVDMMLIAHLEQIDAAKTTTKK
jgi:hypothetical protein